MDVTVGRSHGRGLDAAGSDGEVEDGAIADAGATARQAVFIVAKRFEVLAPGVAPESGGDLGYYAPYAYQSSRYGYDPVYSYRRWTHRQDRDWERRYEASYDYRRDHESARPPRTWADQKRLRLDTGESRERQLLMAAPIDQMAKQKDKPMRIERVPAKERQKITDLSREVRKAREQRRMLETEGVNIASGKNEREIKPTKVRRPASPIVGRSPDRFDKKQAPPKPQRSPIVDREKETSGRKSDAKKNRAEDKLQPEPRDAETKKGRPAPRREVVPDTQKQQPKP